MSTIKELENVRDYLRMARADWQVHAATIEMATTLDTILTKLREPVSEEEISQL